MEYQEDCVPEPVEAESKYHSADFNCINCNQTDCSFWILYNRKDVFDKKLNEL